MQEIDMDDNLQCAFFQQPLDILTIIDKNVIFAKTESSICIMDQPKIERVLKLIQLLAGNINLDINDLAVRLDTSPRSVYRYIDTLSAAGFMVVKTEAGIYKLSKESKWLRQISQMLFITDEEAKLVEDAISCITDDNAVKRNLRYKLAQVYNCGNLARNTVVKNRYGVVHEIAECIADKKQMVFRDYSSAHSGTIRDRQVEPFEFNQNYIQVWCYDIESHKNKIFTTSRIRSAERMDEGWHFEDQHKAGYTDIFHFSSLEQHTAKFEMGILAYDLLMEEYPAAEKTVKKIAYNRWLFDDKVCSYAGVGRFVIGLASDIKVLGSEEFRKYLAEYDEVFVKKL
jgi:Predicted transcriptional regulator